MGNVKDLIGNISNQDAARLELEDSFEIELNGEVYHTLLDMEDGNYIAIDKDRRVFRLHHDSYEPVKEIYPSVEAFLQNFDGDKESMAYLFD